MYCTVLFSRFDGGRAGDEGVELSRLLCTLLYCRFDGGRAGDEGVELSRLLERTLKESRCLDLESLCIVSEEKVSFLSGVFIFLK